MFEVLERELIYLWYYLSVQIERLLPYWVLGILIGSAVSVFLKNKIHGMMVRLSNAVPDVLGITISSALGIISPLCMYGTIPIASSFAESGLKESWIASFMMSSILLNPQLIIYSLALGKAVLLVRVLSCFICGVVAGLLVKASFSEKTFFDFSSFSLPKSRDTDKNIAMRYLKNVGRNIKATGLWFLLGIVLSALFQRYVSEDAVSKVFLGNKAFGVLFAATIGVPLYACGGGTIPLLLSMLEGGMGLGAAAAFMLSGPATKITNLGALKSALNAKHFIMYILYVYLFSVLTGLLLLPF